MTTSLSEYHKKRILITVKTYPTPSKKYQETVCTAGITDTGQWIRLYPIRFRHLEDESKYNLYTWIEVCVRKNLSDFRPESHYVDQNSIKILNHLDSRKNIIDRRNVILPLLKESMEEIQDMYIKSKTSLAVFKPKIVEDLIIERTSSDWTEEEKTILGQASLFDNADQIRLLQKIPYNFSLRFRCNDSRCNGHTMKITSWEINQTYRNYLRTYSTEEKALFHLKAKYLEFFTNEKDGFLFVGTTLPFPTFIIIGHFSYPLKYLRKSEQIEGQVSFSI